MISIITGTLNRKPLLPHLLNNTIFQTDKVELVLVDGGSTDGTLDFLKSINHPNLKLIEVGGRSSYPHFMNLGINQAKHEWICQWNDDALLVNKWEDVISELDDSNFYLFNWKYGSIQDISNPNWVAGLDQKTGWCLNNTKNGTEGEITVNYGLYHKNIFRKIGMYSNAYKYYYCDSDMAERAYCFGYKAKNLRTVKVASIWTPKVATHQVNDLQIFNYYKNQYLNGNLPENLEYLK